MLVKGSTTELHPSPILPQQNLDFMFDTIKILASQNVELVLQDQLVQIHNFYN